MVKIDLLKTPNQKLGFQLENGDNINITIKTAKEVTLLSVSTDFERIIDSAICEPNFIIESYGQIYGFLYWQSQDGQYPNYEKFNTLHNLYYVSPLDYLEILNAE